MGDDMEGFLAFCAVSLWIVFIGWLITRIRYVVDHHYVRVLLGSLTLRKIALRDIVFVDTRSPFWNEHWCNTFWPWNRSVRLRRRSGLIRNFIITPENRDEFVAQIRKHLSVQPIR